jgi:hypothetical protein
MISAFQHFFWKQGCKSHGPEQWYHIWLETEWLGIQSPAGPKDFSLSLCIQTRSEVKPASYPIGTGDPFSGIKHKWGMMLTTHNHLVLMIKNK